jgi:hypothetical protein
MSKYECASYYDPNGLYPYTPRDNMWCYNVPLTNYVKNFTHCCPRTSDIGVMVSEPCVAAIPNRVGYFVRTDSGTLGKTITCDPGKAHNAYGLWTSANPPPEDTSDCRTGYMDLPTKFGHRFCITKYEGRCYANPNPMDSIFACGQWSTDNYCAEDR